MLFKRAKCLSFNNKPAMPLFFRTRTVQRDARQSVIAVRHQPVPENRKDIEVQLEGALQNAKQICSKEGIGFNCMWAWEVVDELLRIYYEWNMQHPLESQDAAILTAIEKLNDGE